jgi:hypothetical protein
MILLPTDRTPIFGWNQGSSWIFFVFLVQLRFCIQIALFLADLLLHLKFYDKISTSRAMGVNMYLRQSRLAESAMTFALARSFSSYLTSSLDWSLTFVGWALLLQVSTERKT